MADLIDEVKARLEAAVPELVRRVESASDYAKLMSSAQAPAHGLVAYILPHAIVAQRPMDAAGAFEQTFDEMIGVVLIFNSTTRDGERGIERLRPFIFDVIHALAGWSPEDVLGEFALARGEMQAPRAGLIAYRIDFTVSNLLRISQ